MPKDNIENTHWLINEDHLDVVRELAKLIEARVSQDDPLVAKVRQLHYLLQERRMVPPDQGRAGGELWSDA